MNTFALSTHESTGISEAINDSTLEQTDSEQSGSEITENVEQKNEYIETEQAGKNEAPEISESSEVKEVLTDLEATTKTKIAISAEDAAVFQGLRDKWTIYLVGDQLNLSDPQVKQYVSQVNQRAVKVWNSMNKKSNSERVFLWQDIPITIYHRVDNDDARISSGNLAKHYTNLLALTTAYRTEGTDFYQDEIVKDEILSGLAFMDSYYYGVKNDYYFGNWHDWEISVPKSLLEIVLLLDTDIENEQKNTYIESVRRFTNVSDYSSVYSGSFKMTGSSILNKGEIVALDGIISNQADKLTHARATQKGVYQYVTSGDGFYRDGSFIQHKFLAYTSGYGKTLFEGASLFFYIFKDTPWEIAYEDGSEQLVFDMLFEAIEPLLYNGQLMDMTNGRGITRKNSNVLTNGAEIIQAILPLRESVPTSQRVRFDSMVKYYISIDSSYFYERSTKLTALLIAKNIMADSTISSRGEYVIHKTYAGMDRIAHIQPAYGFGIAMSSTRQGKNEMWNTEGKRIWNIADGMTYLYTSDQGQYLNGYWATVDPRRLSGTTTEYVMRPNASAGEFGRTRFSWSGGSTLGNYGSAGVQLQSYGSSNVVDGAVSKKSWFMFADEIAALGTEIHSNTGNPVETIIDNRQIQLDGSNKVLIDGVEPAITDNSGNTDKYGTTFKNVKWANIQGNVSGTDIGYYFPAADTEIQAMKENRKDNWINQGSTNAEAEGSYATLWFQHGANPINGNYQYVILPNTSAESTAAYASNPSLAVLANNNDVQAVKNNKLGITGMNFWNDKKVTVGEVTSNNKASVTMKVSESEVELSVSDPTQENTTIELEIAIPCSEVITKADTISVDSTSSSSLKLVINTANANGRSHVVKLKREQLAEVDRSPLEEVIREAEALIVTGKYNDDEAMSSFKQLIEAAKLLLKSESLTTAQINQMIAQLQSAAGKLTMKTGFMLADLAEEIQKSRLVNQDIALGKYLEKGQGSFKEALEVANKVLGNPTSQAEIDTAKSNLMKARIDLRLKPDKSELRELISKAKAIKIADYTPESYSLLKKALEEVQLIVDDEQAEIGQIANGIKNLNSALNGLVERLPLGDGEEENSADSEEEVEFYPNIVPPITGSENPAITINPWKTEYPDKPLPANNQLKKNNLPATGEKENLYLLIVVSGLFISSAVLRVRAKKLEQS